MRVTVRDRATEDARWGIGLFRPELVTVDIADVCPVCGGCRGAARTLHQHEDGVWFDVSVWSNPCGHIDHYGDVLAEAREREAS